MFFPLTVNSHLSVILYTCDIQQFIHFASFHVWMKLLRHHIPQHYCTSGLDMVSCVFGCYQVIVIIIKQ